MRQFVQMSTILPEVSLGDLAISHFSFNEEQKRHAEMCSLMARDFYSMTRYLKTNYTYTRLSEQSDVWMSDTPMEQMTNTEFLNKANGNVLTFGLGIGFIIVPLFGDDDIKSITVVEKNKDIISLVSPYLKCNKLKIIEGDAYKVDFGKEKFDTIYFDIWRDRSSDNYPKTGELQKKFRKNFNTKNPKRYINSWMRNELKSEYYKYSRY